MVGYVYSIYLPLKPSETKVIHTKVVDKCYIVPLGCDPNALSEVKSFEENCHFLLSMLSLGYFGGQVISKMRIVQVCKDLHDEEMQVHLRRGKIINSKTATGSPNYGCNSNRAKNTTSL